MKYTLTDEANLYFSKRHMADLTLVTPGYSSGCQVLLNDNDTVNRVTKTTNAILFLTEDNKVAPASSVYTIEDKDKDHTLRELSACFPDYVFVGVGKTLLVTHDGQVTHEGWKHARSKGVEASPRGLASLCDETYGLNGS